MNDKILKGKAYVLDDKIDTDQIIPACYLTLVPTIPEERVALGSHALSGLPDRYQRFIKEGETKCEYTFIVAPPASTLPWRSQPPASRRS